MSLHGHLIYSSRTNDIFENASLNNDLVLGFKRLNYLGIQLIRQFFFVLLQIQFGVNNNISLKGGQAQQSYHYTREILEKEAFPNKDPQYGITNMSILDLHYYPNERGPYNYTVSGKLGRNVN